jgi:hypothetical protein
MTREHETRKCHRIINRGEWRAESPSKQTGGEQGEQEGEQTGWKIRV